MKKIIALLFAFALTFCAIGCGEDHMRYYHHPGFNHPGPVHHFDAPHRR